jgi:hypothetical protein
MVVPEDFSSSVNDLERYGSEMHGHRWNAHKLQCIFNECLIHYLAGLFSFRMPLWKTRGNTLIIRVLFDG